MGFEFHAEDHSYWLDNRRLLGVTSVLAATGLVDYAHYPDEKRAYYLRRGSAIHEAAHQIINGTFDWSYCENEGREFAGFIRAVDSFLATPGLKVLASEEPVYSRELGYAGTLDLLVRYQGRFALPDLKSNKAQYATSIQCVAYLRALQSLGELIGYVYAGEPHDRYAVELHEDGKFKIRWYDELENYNDEGIWLAALSVAGWQMRHAGRLTR